MKNWQKILYRSILVDEDFQMAYLKRKRDPYNYQNAIRDFVLNHVCYVDDSTELNMLEMRSILTVWKNYCNYYTV